MMHHQFFYLFRTFGTSLDLPHYGRAKSRTDMRVGGGRRFLRSGIQVRFKAIAISIVEKPGQRFPLVAVVNFGIERRCRSEDTRQVPAENLRSRLVDTKSTSNSIIETRDFTVKWETNDQRFQTERRSETRFLSRIQQGWCYRGKLASMRLERAKLGIQKCQKLLVTYELISCFFTPKSPQSGI